MKKLQILILVSLISGFGSTSGSAHETLSFYKFFSFPTTNPNILSTDEFEELLKAAYEFYKQQKYDEGLAACKKAAELNPQDFRPFYIAGIIYFRQSKYQNASESFAKAIELKPDNKFGYLQKAYADQMRGAKVEAVAAARRALEIDPSFVEAFLIIGNTLQDDEKRRDEADAAYRAAVKIDPQGVNYFEMMGERLLYQEKDEKGAEEYYKKAVKFDPNQMAGRFALGRLLVKQGRLKEARTLWEGKTTDQDNMMPKFITVLERAENLQKATEALAQKPDDPETLLKMGYAVMDGDSWVVDGTQDRAIVYFRKALKIKPDFAAAQYGICKAYVQIADTFESKNKELDKELVKLKRMNARLAKELEEYRKTYSGGILAAPTVKQKQ